MFASAFTVSSPARWSSGLTTHPFRCAGSSQSRRASEAQGNSAVEEGAGGGAGLLLGRLGSGFGSGALDDQLVCVTV